MAASSDNRRPKIATAPGAARRKLLLASAPVVLTLASRPALAGVCTGSAAASFDLNNSSGNPVANLNCGVAPSCWTLRATNEGAGAWLGTSYAPTDPFATIFAGPGLAIIGNSTWRANPAGATLADALGGFVTIQYVSTPSAIYDLGAVFAAEATAALLNASFDAAYPNDFPLTVANVLSSVTTLWAYDPPAPPADDATQLATQVNNRITAYVTARGDGEPCDL